MAPQVAETRRVSGLSVALLEVAADPELRARLAASPALIEAARARAAAHGDQILDVVPWKLVPDQPRPPTRAAHAQARIFHALERTPASARLLSLFD